MFLLMVFGSNILEYTEMDNVSPGGTQKEGEAAQQYIRKQNG
jgi:hypothetical protein